MRVIIPMAGSGARFRAAGFTVAKPLIPVAQAEMLRWAIACLPPNASIFAPCHLADEDALRPLAAQFKRLTLIPLPGKTEGAACTVLAAAVGLPQDDPVLVMNCDQYAVFDAIGACNRGLEAGWDGYILTFAASDPKWSFVETNAEGFVTRVAEKDPISSQATVGIYWFRRARDLVWACSTSIAKDTRVRGEFYLCPVYQHLIDRGAKIAAVPATAMYGLGTPEDVVNFANLQGHA